MIEPAVYHSTRDDLPEKRAFFFLRARFFFTIRVIVSESSESLASVSAFVKQSME
jgi:hypothetical protein